TLENVAVLVSEHEHFGRVAQGGGESAPNRALIELRCEPDVVLYSVRFDPSLRRLIFLRLRSRRAAHPSPHVLMQPVQELLCLFGRHGRSPPSRDYRKGLISVADAKIEQALARCTRRVRRFARV